MDELFYRPNILKLIGISLSDYKPIEDIADEVYLNGSPIHTEMPQLQLDKIPRVFTTLNEWPTSTNLKCWVCDFTFDGYPKFVPTYIRETEKPGNIEFGVLGNMCSFNCAQLYIETIYANNGRENQRRAQDNLRLVYLIFTGHRIDRIKAAYSKTELRQYGGEWDENTFRLKLNELDPFNSNRIASTDASYPEQMRMELVHSSITGSAQSSFFKSRILSKREKNIWQLMHTEDLSIDELIECLE